MSLTNHFLRLSRGATRLPSMYASRTLTTTSLLRAEIGPHATKEKDGHNVQQDAVRDAKEKKNETENGGAGKEGGDGGAAVSEKSGGENEKAKLGTKAPGPVIGMNDERGGVS